jgi:hypothetical protein
VWILVKIENETKQIYIEQSLMSEWSSDGSADNRFICDLDYVNVPVNANANIVITSDKS